MDSTAHRPKPAVLYENRGMVHIYWLYYSNSWKVNPRTDFEYSPGRHRVMSFRLSASTP